MNRLSIQERAKILGCLVEGVSVRATCRITGAAKKTVLRLVAKMGAACAAYHDKHVRNVRSKRVQCDEIWSFCYAKKANVPERFKGIFGFGDVWTWTGFDADSKMILAYRVDTRDEEAAYNFIHDLAGRLANRVQLTTDGRSVYLDAVEDAFGADVDFAQLVKLYGTPSNALKDDARRYSPAECTGTQKRRKIGNPVRKDISTSHVERMNLNIRMEVRRFTRLTNAFSKKVANHAHAMAIYFMYYNYGRIHQTLRVTPAMQAKLTDHLWSLEEIAALAEPVKKTAETATG